MHSFELGGSECVAIRLCAEWAKLGAGVRVVLGREDGNMRAGAPDLPYEFFQHGPLSTAPVETLWMIYRLTGWLSSHKPDVLFFPGNSYAVVAVAVKLLLGKHCPPIVFKVSNDQGRASHEGGWISRPTRAPAC